MSLFCQTIQKTSVHRVAKDMKLTRRQTTCDLSPINCECLLAGWLAGSSLGNIWEMIYNKCYSQMNMKAIMLCTSVSFKFNCFKKFNKLHDFNVDFFFQFQVNMDLFNGYFDIVCFCEYINFFCGVLFIFSSNIQHKLSNIL